jgi:hypothetical protein
MQVSPSKGRRGRGRPGRPRGPLRHARTLLSILTATGKPSEAAGARVQVDSRVSTEDGLLPPPLQGRGVSPTC